METPKPHFFYKQQPSGQKEYLQKFAARVNLTESVIKAPITITDVPLTREK